MRGVIAPLCVALLGCVEPFEAVGEAEDALTPWYVGRWTGEAAWVGPPPVCPFGAPGDCDHGVELNIVCGGSGVATYTYPAFDLVCTNSLTQPVTTGRYTRWQDRPQQAGGCMGGPDGVMTLGPAYADGSVGFRWERADNGEEDTTGTVVRTGWNVCAAL